MIKIEQHGEVIQFIMAREYEGKPVYTMACYFIDGLMIDTGPAHVNHEIIEAMAPYEVKQIVNTHHHEDHIGNNKILLEHYNLPHAYAHEKALPLISNPQLWSDEIKPYQQFAWGQPEASQVMPIGKELATDKYTFKIIPTPGHSEDHICLLEEKKGWLFVGDMYITDKPAVTRKDENINEIIKSIEEILKYDFNTIFCAAGKIVEDGKAALQRRYDNFIKIRSAVTEMHQAGHTPEEIREQVLGRESILHEASEGDMAKINLVYSLISEL